jgi:hypothetical protein
MADNTEVINPRALNAAGDTIATDDVDGVKFQKVKINTGESGVDGGEVTSENRFPVADSIWQSSSSMRDAFGRVRISGQDVLGYGSFEYGLNDRTIETDTNGAGAVANLVNESSISLTNGGSTSGDYAIAQTRVFHRYTPGRSQLIKFTGSFGTPKANCRQRAGYFSERDGLFLEYDGLDLYFVRRTYTSGVVVDNRVARADWDDPMDGTGVSGINLDLTKTWLCWIDMEWLGVGRYRFGFASPATGSLVPADSKAGANLLAVPYMRTANLPVRYEIENTGSSSSTTMKWICYSVDTEGGDEGDLPIQRVVDGGLFTQTLAFGVYRPVTVLRPKTTGPNGVPNRGQLVIKDIQGFVTGSNSVHFEVVLNPTGLTQNLGAPVYASAGDISEATSFAGAANDSVTGGTVVAAFYVGATTQAKSGDFAGLGQALKLVYTELNSVQDTLVVTAQGNGATTCAAAITYVEKY